MNIAVPVSSEVTGVEFSIYTSSELKSISVKSITEPVAINVYGQPNLEGLYDPALGANELVDICSTCNLSYPACPGHFGHIELPFPVINVLFFEEVVHLLSSLCFFCHHFKCKDDKRVLYESKFQLLRAGLILEAKSLDDFNATNALNTVEAGEDNDELTSDHVYVQELKNHVASLLSQKRKPRHSRHSHYSKSNASYSEFIELKKSFLALCRSMKVCKRCQAPSVEVRTEAHYKVFEKPMPKKALETLKKLDFKMPNVLENVKLSKKDSTVSIPSTGDFTTHVSHVSHAADEIDSSSESSDSSSDSSEESSFSECDLKTKPNPVIDPTTGGSKLITPLHILEHFRLLFQNESSLTGYMYGGITKPNQIDPVMFFYEVIPVPPNRFRPAALLNGEAMENSQTIQLSNILKTIQTTRGLLQKLGDCTRPGGPGGPGDRLKLLIDGWLNLQRHVNSFIDSERGLPAPIGKEPAAGIKQILEKKEGLFRKHMMGKRVNYAARSVISPDVNIETNEVGLPLVFAKRLTYPEPVTHYNVKKLQAAVINGPDVWPGATHVQHEDGTLTTLESLSMESRTALANQLFTPQNNLASLPSGNCYINQSIGINKKVYRHIESGDYVLFNRQPTLHKPSIMSHKVRVLPNEKTIRMHYANCNTYNADFDGDEMNVHFPQNELARAEAISIANTDNQYLVPTNGAPLRGLIQDHVAVAVTMTSRDTFFTREEYHQLLYGSLRPENDAKEHQRILTFPPAIVFPRRLWTGKQVITTIMANLTRGSEPINLISKARVNAKFWEGAAPEEGQVMFSNGEFVTGILDKNQFGASAYGLVHTVYELYGPGLAGKLLGVLGRLFTKYCQSYGFTCRMDDLRLTSEGDGWRRELIDSSTVAGHEATVQFIGLENREQFNGFQEDFTRRMEEVYRDDEKMQGLDATMKSKMNAITSNIINQCIPNGLYRKFPENHMQAMTVSGAKGSNVNVSQISCLLGQQELEGRRVPVMISGKTLPSFQPFETSARAGGFISGRFLTGIKPQEYFFHCMAGREGLIDTAVKTSRSGYLQRCIIKHLESLKVNYDNTVRDCDGSVIQFQYGEDGLDVIKQKHLTEFGFAASNYYALKQNHLPGQAIHHINSDKAFSYNRKAIKKPHKYDPVLSVYSPSRYFGSVSEKFYKSLEAYLKSNPDNLPWDDLEATQPGHQPLNKERFRALMNLKYMHSLVEPGEAVGLLAAQSIGEPSTQMTLNTFHFAGFGAKNVTLGIPRLREIVMTASKNIMTPSMTLTIKPEISDTARDNFCRRATKLRLSEITDEIQVTESVIKGDSGASKEYRVVLKFFPESEYGPEFGIDRRLVEKSMVMFSKRFEYLIMKELRKQGINISLKNVDQGESNIEPIDDIIADMDPKQRVDDLADEEAEESDAGDNDASDAKRAAKRQQMASYDAPEDSNPTIPEHKPKQTRPERVTVPVESGESVKDTITEKAKYITSFSFDEEQGGWAEFILDFQIDIKKILMVGIAEAACKLSVIRHIEQIDRVYPITNDASDDERRLVSTDGMNLKGIWQYYDIIDVDSIETNDIYAVLTTYGVEAARNAIKKEIASVFAVYGIEVDSRHLSLIADYMTFEGGYKPFNRLSMKTNTSPFQKMSFETTTNFLTAAALTHDTDDLSSPSAKIVLGKVVEGGTGSFQILHPLQSSPVQ